MVVWGEYERGYREGKSGDRGEVGRWEGMKKKKTMCVGLDLMWETEIEEGKRAKEGYERHWKNKERDSANPEDLAYYS